MQTTIGQLLVNDVLPDEYKDYTRVLDKKTIKNTLSKLTATHPEKYPSILKRLSDIGWKTAARSGGYSISTADLKTADAAKKYRAEFKKQADVIYKNSQMTQKQKDDAIVQLSVDLGEKMRNAIYDELTAAENPAAMQVMSGAKGNKISLSALLGMDMLYTGADFNPIPFPVLKNYSEGLDPLEYWAGAFGARRGVIDVKLATRDAGYLAKQLVQIAHRGVITAHDADEPPKYLCGLPTTTDDNDNIGRLLAHDVGGYKRNTIITDRVLHDLDKKGVKNILVRSPIVGGPWDSSLYAADVGMTDKGRLPVIGENPAVTAVQSLSEPLSQGAMCLAKGTMVKMGDLTEKPIEEIVVGDQVWGFDKQADKASRVSVTNVFDNGIRHCYKYTFQTKYGSYAPFVICTEDHKFYSVTYRRQLWERGDNPIGAECDAYYTSLVRWMQHAEHQYHYDSKFRLVSVEDVGDRQTYDIEVDTESHLFVLSSGLITSNSSKHTGGVYGAFAAKAVSGFKLINQIIQVPKVYSGGAAHAQTDGTVQAIEKAPAGGYYVFIDNKKHFIPNDQELKVKEGDSIEAGDILSDGLPNPAEVVRHKGIGEGRKYFTDTMLDACKNAGMSVTRRNVEMLARGLVNHVKLNKEYGDWLPDETVPYRMLENYYQPRNGAAKSKPEYVKNQYLEHPVLHYTIGTKLRPSVIKTLQNFGIKEVIAHKDPPIFDTEMIRGQSVLQNDPDWLVRMFGSGQKRGVLEAAHLAKSTNPLGTSFVPALVTGVDFTKHVNGQPISKVTSPRAFLPPEKKAPRLDYEIEDFEDFK